MATVENKRLKKKGVDAVANRQPRFRCAERPGRVRGPGFALPEAGAGGALRRNDFDTPSLKGNC